MTVGITNWESLIKDRMRPCIRLAEDDASIRNRKNRERRRDRTEYRKRYREQHHEELLKKKREYNASDHGRTVNAEYNARWRKEHKEYERERKARWWKLKHPNPKPIGRPRNEHREDN